MYSATFPITIKSFKQKYLPKAEVLNCMDELMLLGLTHYYILVEEKQKIMALNTIYAKLVINQCIIFCSSVQRVEMLSKKLKEKGYENLFLHSKMSPADRTRYSTSSRVARPGLWSVQICAREVLTCRVLTWSSILTFPNIPVLNYVTQRPTCIESAGVAGSVRLVWQSI